jgi:hypothetical protein
MKNRKIKLKIARERIFCCGKFVCYEQFCPFEETDMWYADDIITGQPIGCGRNPVQAYNNAKMNIKKYFKGASL